MLVSKRVKRLLQLVPGKRRFGVYRFLPFFFLLGGAMEWFMINVRIGKETFCDGVWCGGGGGVLTWRTSKIISKSAASLFSTGWDPPDSATLAEDTGQKQTNKKRV
uniref:Ubiquinol-cytochrome c reductase complex assembly factor 5 n=2 Tax=Telluraves TaxID=3073808 RepID=A0A663EU63_AQUCH